MARKIFTSFHYKPDNWRVSMVRNIGAIDGNKLAHDNEWESITQGGAAAIQKWIDDQMRGTSCVIVLIGAETAGRKWIEYEIEKGWNDGKGLLGIHIHNLKDKDGKQTPKGRNPFEGFTVGSQNKPLTGIVKTYDPPYTSSTDVYDHIKNNIDDWIEDALNIHGRS